MKKILMCLFLAFGYGVANDETTSDKNGILIGAEFGMSEMNEKRNTTVNTGTNIVTTVNTEDRYRYSAQLYGFKVGYKHFFTDLIGLQGYLSFKDAIVSTKNKGKDETSITAGDVTVNGKGTRANSEVYHFMPLMANADVIFDFYKINNLSLDAIIGVGLGVAIVNYKYSNSSSSDLTVPTGSSTRRSYAGFYSDIKVGFGVNYDNSRIGVAAAFPMNSVNTTIDDVKYKTKLNYVVSLTYDYTF